METLYDKVGSICHEVVLALAAWVLWCFSDVELVSYPRAVQLGPCGGKRIAP